MEEKLKKPVPAAGGPTGQPGSAAKAARPAAQEATPENTEGFDFGGLPQDVDFKRGIGCGG